MTTQTLLDKRSQRFCLAWKVLAPKTAEAALPSNLQPAREEVSKATRSNQNPRCREGRLDRQTDITQPPVSAQALILETEDLSQPHRRCSCYGAAPLGKLHRVHG